MTGLASGLRLAAVVVVFAAFVVWKFLPARAPGHDHVPSATGSRLSGVDTELVGSIAASG